MSNSGISWAIRKSAPPSSQITTPVPHHSLYLQAGCSSCSPTNSVKALKAKYINITKSKDISRSPLIPRTAQWKPRERRIRSNANERAQVFLFARIFYIAYKLKSAAMTYRVRREWRSWPTTRCWASLRGGTRAGTWSESTSCAAPSTPCPSAQLPSRRSTTTAHSLPTRNNKLCNRRRTTQRARSVKIKLSKTHRYLHTTTASTSLPTHNHSVSANPP